MAISFACRRPFAHGVCQLSQHSLIGRINSVSFVSKQGGPFIAFPFALAHEYCIFSCPFFLKYLRRAVSNQLLQEHPQYSQWAEQVCVLFICLFLSFSSSDPSCIRQAKAGRIHARIALTQVWPPLFRCDFLSYHLFSFPVALSFLLTQLCFLF